MYYLVGRCIVEPILLNTSISKHFILSVFFLQKCRKPKFNTCISNSPFSPDRRTCVACPNFKYIVNDAGDCEECPEGTIPNNVRDSCHKCQPDEYLRSFGDVCIKCQQGYIPSENRAYCKPCPSSQIAYEGNCESCQNQTYE